MKKIIALILSLIMLAGAASVLAEAEGKVTIGTISINGAFTLQCGLPEGYHPVPTSVTPEQVTAAIRSDDPLAPVMQLSVAYDEKYYDVDRMNDLTPEELTQLEETYIEEDPEVEITYGETGYGTQLLIARHETEELDFIAFFSIYKGYCVEFVLAPSEQAEDRNLTEEQLRLSIDFLTDLDFIPANIPADPKTLVADGKYVTNISDYDPETNTVKLDVRHTVVLDKAIAEALRPGDILIVGQFSEKIDTLEHDEDGALRINEYITLENYGGEYHVYLDDYEYLENYVTLTQEIPEDLTFSDGIDPETGDPLDTPTEHTAQEFIAMLTAGGYPDFATDNAYAAFDENGDLIAVERFYTPWQ